MNSKNILFSFLILVLALIIVSAANAIDNETVLDDKRLKVRVTKADDRKALEINLVVEELSEEEIEQNSN